MVAPGRHLRLNWFRKLFCRKVHIDWGVIRKRCYGDENISVQAYWCTVILLLRIFTIGGLFYYVKSFPASFFVGINPLSRSIFNLCHIIEVFLHYLNFIWAIHLVDEFLCGRRHVGVLFTRGYEFTENFYVGFFKFYKRYIKILQFWRPTATWRGFKDWGITHCQKSVVAYFSLV